MFGDVSKAGAEPDDQLLNFGDDDDEVCDAHAKELEGLPNLARES